MPPPLAGAGGALAVPALAAKPASTVPQHSNSRGDAPAERLKVQGRLQPEGAESLTPVTPGICASPDEPGRLKAVRAMRSAYAEPQPRVDAITTLLKNMFDTQMAVVTLIDDDLHFVSRAGQWPRSAEQAGSFCERVLVPEVPTMLIIEDAREDIRFRDSPYVKGEPYLRFYAGAPLVSSDGGHRLGTLCVFDTRPRTFSAQKYGMIASFAEILVREMERSLALRLENERLQQERVEQRAKAAHTHLLRAMDCFHEGIVLLDLSSAHWHMVYANDAFREASGLPHLLSGGPGEPGGSGGGGGSGRGGGSGQLAARWSLDSPPPLDFWQIFGHVADGTSSLYNDALLAMVAGKEFSMTVQPKAGGANQGANGSSSGHGHQPPPVLRMLFRPADSEQLHAPGMPAIGVPACAMDGDSPATPAGSAWRGQATPSPLTTLVEAGGATAAAEGACARQQPAYYFGILQQGQAGQPGKGQGQPCVLSMAWAGGSPMPSNNLGQSPVLAADQSDSSLLIPSFYQMRPEIMGEVSLGNLIGSGAMGRCYRGMWQGGRVAVKVIECRDGRLGAAFDDDTDASHLESGPQSACARAAMVEALLARCLSHPHIVTTFSYGVSACEQAPGASLGAARQQVWIVQEYCSKGSLLEAVDRGLLLRPGGKPNLQALLMCAQEIAGALSYLHSHGVIHGDLTPSNILMAFATKDTRRWICKVADFGLSQLVGGEEELQIASFGTVTHMCPQVLMSGSLSKASDVFSFGIIMLELLYGTRAWLGCQPVQILAQVGSGELPFDIPEGLPPPFASLLHRCLHLDPAARPTFATILGEVQQLVREMSGPQDAPSPVTPTLEAAAASQPAASQPAAPPPAWQPQLAAPPPERQPQQVRLPAPSSGAGQSPGAAAVPAGPATTSSSSSRSSLAPPFSVVLASRACSTAVSPFAEAAGVAPPTSIRSL